MNNMYNTDINATRNLDNTQNPTGLEQNPYIKNQVNMDPNAMNPMANNLANNQQDSLFTNGDFIKGALIGAAVTFLLTNKGAQDSIMKAASKGNELFQAGMEEMKERYEDARAQMEANQH